MKIKELIACLVFVVAFCGCDDTDDLLSQNQRLQSEVEEMRGKLSKSASEVETLRDELGQMKKNLESTQSELSGAKQTIERQSHDLSKTKGAQGWFWKGTTVGVVVFVLVLAIPFVFCARRRRNAGSVNADDGQLRCPRCGWKYSTGETKCKKCGTRF